MIVVTRVIWSPFDDDDDDVVVGVAPPVLYPCLFEDVGESLERSRSEREMKP